MEIRPREEGDVILYTLPRQICEVVVSGFAPWSQQIERPRVRVFVNAATPGARRWKFEVSSGVVTVIPPEDFDELFEGDVTFEMPSGIKLTQKE